MEKTAQEITMDLLKGEAVVIDPVAKILEKEEALKKLGYTLGIGHGRDNKVTNAFFNEQEAEFAKVKKEFIMYVYQAKFKGAHESTVFEDFDFKIIVTKK
jgi:hypothetical protein